MVDMSWKGDDDVRQICSTALNQVPPEMVELDERMVKVLVSLLKLSERSVVGEAGNVVSEPSLHDLQPWTMRRPLLTENTIDVQPSWINCVCQDLEVSGVSVCSCAHVSFLSMVVSMLFFFLCLLCWRHFQTRPRTYCDTALSTRQDGSKKPPLPPRTDQLPENQVHNLACNRRHRYCRGLCCTRTYPFSCLYPST